MSCRTLSRVLSCALVLLTSGFLLTTPAPLAHAQSEVDSAVSIRSLSPAIPAPEGNLALSGTIVNGEEEPATNIEMYLTISYQPLNDFEALAAVNRGEYQPSARTVPADFRSPDELDGASASRWQTNVAVDSLEMTTSGVYTITVTGSSNGVQLGSDTTYLSWFPPGTPVSPVELIWLWPVSDQPNRTAKDTLLSNQTGDELSPGGRLSRILEYGVAAGNAATWIFDPQVLETATTMANGYDVVDADGQLTKGPSADAAARWLDKTRQEMASRNFYSMPYANPDVTALTGPSAGLGDIVVRSAAGAADETTAALGKAPLGTLGWPTGSRLTSTSLDTLHRAGLRAAVLAESAVEDSENEAAARIATEAGDLTGFISHQGISASVSNLGPERAAPVKSRQQFLALTALWAQSDFTSRYLVVAPDPLWDPSPTVVAPIVRQLKSARWLSPARLNELRAATQQSDSEAARLAPMTTLAQRAALGSRFTNSIRVSQRRLSGLSDIIETPGVVTQPYSQALIRVGSSAWRYDRAAGLDLSRVVSEQLDQQIDDVRVLDGGTKHLSGGSTSVPITIANDLSVPVRVALRLSSNPAIRLSASPVPPTLIPPNRKVSLAVQAQVIGSGSVQATAQLLTPEGRPYGKPVPITLQNSAYTQVATWVVTGAFAVLVVLLVANSIRRRRKQHSESPNSSAQDHDE